MEALSQCCGISDYTLVVSAEPGFRDVLDVIKGIKFCNVVLNINPRVFGNSLNTLTAIGRGFEITDFFVIHLEDDVVFARDALLMFEECAKKYRNNPHVFSVTAYNSEGCAQSEENINRLSFRQWFHPWGWGTWKHKYDAIAGSWPMRNWDIHINTRLRNGRFEIFPIMSRSQNIGVTGGVHSNYYDETWYQKNHFATSFSRSHFNNYTWQHDLDNFNL